MKSAFIVLCFVACAYANDTDKDAVVVTEIHEQDPDGGFNYGFESNNGISGSAKGVLRTVGKEEAVVVSGSNSYTSPGGEIIELTYVADENGYQPQGAHLPTTPAPIPIPDYIVRAIEYIAAHPYVEKKN